MPWECFCCGKIIKTMEGMYSHCKAQHVDKSVSRDDQHFEAFQLAGHADSVWDNPQSREEYRAFGSSYRRLVKEEVRR